MPTYTLILWLTFNGPEVNMDVSNCDYKSIRPWVADARDWAERSGLDPQEVGYLCWQPRWQFVKVRSHR